MGRNMQGAATEDQIWAGAQKVPLAEIKKNPDPYTAKTFVFYGSIGNVQISEESKLFDFQERDERPKRGWDAFAPPTGPSIEVHFDTWHAEKAKSAQGRAEVRYLSTFRNMPASSRFTAQQHYILATVQQYSDTFTPYLQLVSIRENPSTSDVASQSTGVDNSSHSASAEAASQSTSAIDFGHSASTVLANLETEFPNANSFREHTLSLPVNYDITWTTFLAKIEQLKYTILVSNKDKGTVVTQIRKQGFVIPEYVQVIAAIERDGDSQSKISLKALRYSRPDRSGWYQGKAVEADDDRLVGQIRSAYSGK